MSRAKLQRHHVGVAIAALLAAASGSVSAAPPQRTTRDVRAIQQRKQDAALEHAPNRIGGIAKEKVLFYSRLWPLKSRIRVAFDGEHTELYSRIAELGNRWTEDTTISFDFGQGANFYRWSRADAKNEYPVRVAFRPGAFYSFMGTEWRDCPPPPKKRSPWLFQPRFVTTKELDVSVLHEIGHVLAGIPHVFNHPDASVDFNKQRLTEAFRDPEFELLIGPSQSSWTPLLPSPRSVMSYTFSSDLFLRGKESPWFQPKMQDALSDYDRQLVHLMYGKYADRPAVGAVQLEDGFGRTNKDSAEPNYELKVNETWRLVDPSVLFDSRWQQIMPVRC